MLRSIRFILARLGQGQASASFGARPLVRKEAGPTLSDTCSASIAGDAWWMSRAPDVRWAMADGCDAQSLGAVIGEVWGDPPALSFTAKQATGNTRKASGVPCWL